MDDITTPVNLSWLNRVSTQKINLSQLTHDCQPYLLAQVFFWIPPLSYCAMARPFQRRLWGRGRRDFLPHSHCAAGSTSNEACEENGDSFSHKVSFDYREFHLNVVRFHDIAQSDVLFTCGEATQVNGSCLASSVVVVVAFSSYSNLRLQWHFFDEFKLLYHLN